MGVDPKTELERLRADRALLLRLVAAAQRRAELVLARGGKTRRAIRQNRRLLAEIERLTREAT
jgi:hypothetical protein